MATVEEQIRSIDSQAADEINKYIDELKGEAQGDYDFVVKFLKKQFETALGTDDSARAEFFSKVANQLEKRVGRIPFDFDVKTGREKVDIANFLRRTDIEDTDLRARELEFQQQQEFATGLETEQRKEEFGARGLLDSGLQKKRASQQAEARRLQTDPVRRAFELERTRRGEQVGEAKLQSGRRLEDIETSARRGGEDVQFGFEKGSEAASRDLEKRLAAVERTGAQERRTVLGQLTQEELLKKQLGQFG
jgi:hypothetical protein